jgi:tetratricopeptide (TPR) repeat protein
MFYGWLGIAHYMAGIPKDAYRYLRKALNFGEQVKESKVIGYACAWLPHVCGELGLFEEGLGYSQRAQQIAVQFPSDQYIFFKSLAGKCFIYFYMGNIRKVFEGAECLLEHAEKYKNSRCKVYAHWKKAFGHLAAGNFKLAQEHSKIAIEVSRDPFYGQFPKITLGAAYLLNEQFDEAENALSSCLKYCEKNGVGQILTICQYSIGPILIAKGQMKEGRELIEEAQETLKERGRRISYSLSEYLLGEIYSQIATGPKPSLSIMAKNIGFLVKNVPFAGRTAEDYFCRAIETFKEKGMKSYLGVAYLSLGLLYKNTRKTGQARQHIMEAMKLFKECEAQGYLEQAKVTLDSLS